MVIFRCGPDVIFFPWFVVYWFPRRNPQENKRATWQRLTGRLTPVVQLQAPAAHNHGQREASSPTRPRSAPPPAARSRLAAAVAPSRSHLRQLRSIERRNPWPPRRCSSGRRRWRIHPFRLPDARPRLQRRRLFGRLPRPHSLGYLMLPLAPADPSHLAHALSSFPAKILGGMTWFLWIAQAPYQV